MSFTDLPLQSPINDRADVYAVTALALSRTVAASSTCALDVAYGDDYWQKIDIYLPPQQASGLPVFVAIHGGGWTHGYKEWMGFMAPPLVSLPAILVSVSYRLAPAVRYPAPLDDCLAALAWVHKNIARHGGDPKRIFIGGHSAGAHLAALVTLRRDLYAAHGLPDDAVKACFPFSGVYDFTDPAAAATGTAMLADAETRRAASPLFHVAGNRTPFVVTWAENEKPYILSTSAAFVEALKRERGRLVHYMFPLFDHFYIHLDMQRPESKWVRTVRAWMREDPATAPVFF
jgi:acetyl esterase/lipase